MYSLLCVFSQFECVGRQTRTTKDTRTTPPPHATPRGLDEDLHAYSAEPQAADPLQHAEQSRRDSSTPPDDISFLYLDTYFWIIFVVFIFLEHLFILLFVR